VGHLVVCSWLLHQLYCRHRYVVFGTALHALALRQKWGSPLIRWWFSERVKWLCVYGLLAAKAFQLNVVAWAIQADVPAPDQQQQALAAAGQVQPCVWR
jgi:hypothetical protein